MRAFSFDPRILALAEVGLSWTG